MRVCGSTAVCGVVCVVQTRWVCARGGVWDTRVRVRGVRGPGKCPRASGRLPRGAGGEEWDSGTGTRDVMSGRGLKLREERGGARAGGGGERAPRSPELLF